MKEKTMSKLPAHTWDDGPDVELEAIGLTEQDVDDAVEFMRNTVAERDRGGRPSLTGKSEHSPQLAFRVNPDARQRLQELADAEHAPVSTIARRAIDEYLINHPTTATG